MILMRLNDKDQNKSVSNKWINQELMKNDFFCFVVFFFKNPILKSERFNIKN